MIEIKIPRRKINMFIKNLKLNIMKESGNIAYETTVIAKKNAVSYVPIFEGTLKGAIYRRVNKKTKKGRVSILPSQMNVALLNELGGQAGVYSEPTLQDEQGLYTPDDMASPKLKRWLIAKGRTRLYPNGPNTRWGRKNKFMNPAYRDTIKRVPGIMARAIERACKKSII